MENLLDLVDEHTEYFKSHLEALPPQERRVYLALARLWKPSTTREIADLARLNTSTCSAQLKRLVQRGAVVIEGGTPRRRHYYLTERLYNIYYLMRAGRGTDRIVEALCEFMVCLYSQTELAEIIGDLYEYANACGFLTSDIAGQMASTMVRHAMSLQKAGMLDEALDLYDRVIDRLESDDDSGIEVQVAAAQMLKSALLIQKGSSEEAVATCDDLLQRFGESCDDRILMAVASAWSIKARLLAIRDELEAALLTFEQASIHADKLKSPLTRKLRADVYLGQGALLYKGGRDAAALDSFNKVLAQYPLPSEPHFDSTLAFGITGKAFLLYESREAIGGDEFSLLLECLAEIGSLTPGSVEALMTFIVSVKPAEALKMLEASPAVSLVEPLIIALQQELGQTPQVAKEVAEIASDVRDRLALTKDGHLESTLQDRTT